MDAEKVFERMARRGRREREGSEARRRVMESGVARQWSAAGMWPPAAVAAGGGGGRRRPPGSG